MKKSTKLLSDILKNNSLQLFQFLVEQTYVSTDKFEVLDKNQRQEHPVIHFNSDSFS